MITGGWEFIWGAYGLTWTVLALYSVSLWFRFKKIRKREKELS